MVHARAESTTGIVYTDLYCAPVQQQLVEHREERTSGALLESPPSAL